MPWILNEYIDNQYMAILVFVIMIVLYMDISDPYTTASTSLLVQLPHKQTIITPVFFNNETLY